MKNRGLKNIFPKRNPRCVYRIIEDMCLIVDVDRLTFHTLNEVGSIVWELCNGRNSISKIINYISNNFNANINEIAKDCVEYIGDLEKKNLLLF